ncbi:MAG TPA: hypothetical protein DCY88_00635 [Cyanobacteria bacterium UBA11372]|nr:hypothetical protein [Cyanobacteria bacterium UBA11372]
MAIPDKICSNSLFLLSQMVDCLSNDYGFTASELYLMAAAANSTWERGKQRTRIFFSGCCR